MLHVQVLSFAVQMFLAQKAESERVESLAGDAQVCYSVSCNWITPQLYKRSIELAVCDLC
jgi:hypothetical protein